MKEDGKLPECNPLLTCQKCGKKLPMFRLYLFIGETTCRIAHNFCPDDDGHGGIVRVCGDCKRTKPRD